MEGEPVALRRGDSLLGRVFHASQGVSILPCHPHPSAAASVFHNALWSYDNGPTKGPHYTCRQPWALEPAWFEATLPSVGERGRLPHAPPWLGAWVFIFQGVAAQPKGFKSSVCCKSWLEGLGSNLGHPCLPAQALAQR